MDSRLEENERGKRVVRYILHLVHLSVALLLVVCVLLNLIFGPWALLSLYLVPFILVLLIIEIARLLHRPPPQQLKAKLGAFDSLRVRGYLYQCAGVMVLLQGKTFNGSLSLPVTILACIVWGDGIALFFLALVAREVGFEDWVEDPEPNGIRLSESREDLPSLVSPVERVV